MYKMIPRTKHLIIVVAVILGVLILIALFSMVKRVGTTVAFLPPQTALVITTEEETKSVVVATDTTREDTRASLKEQLRAYASESKPVEKERLAIEAVPEPQSETLIEEKKADAIEGSILLCNPSAPKIAVSSWGPVNIILVEGARVVTSVAADIRGVPLHTLQLPESPTIGTEPSCLPSGMVGVGLDGSVFTANTQVSADAEGLRGYALDGFPIYASYEDEKEVTSTDLDMCHGHTHAILHMGASTVRYHYHVTSDAPYILGCFKGTPVEI